MRTRLIAAAILVATLVMSTLVVVVGPSAPAQAADASQFNPGLIISDAKFFNGAALTASDVQNFLNTHGPACQAGYTCLRSYHQVTTDKVAQPGNCDAYVSSGDETAATIIARVGQICGISQAALIVLLQKEQGLVTSSAPSATAYRSATGYGCPDTSACDANYYGFFNQVYDAALQFRRYAANPTHWNYLAGRVNSILYSPNLACGAGDVLIQNQATAGLYNYTPYQPNAAALAHLYGTGDSCSSYGNRNFWAYYTDWFGPTNDPSLVRTISNPQIYLVSGSTKYPINDANTYGAYGALGGFGYVQQSYLDTLTTGPVAGRIIRGPDGAIYFIDAAIKTQFTTCAQVADYGGNCSPTGYVQLTAIQVNAFHTGPYATQVLGTVEGSRYWLSAGIKREVLDDQSQAAAGLQPGFNVLTEAAIASLPYGVPIIRDDVVVKERDTAAYDYVTGGRRRTISVSDASSTGTATRSAGTMRPQSMALVPSDGAFTGAVVTAGSSDLQLLTKDGRVHLTDPTASGSLSPATVSASVLASYPDIGSIATGSFVKSVSDPTVYQVTALGLRPVASWDILLKLAAAPAPTVWWLPTGVVDALPKGPPVLPPASLYRSTDNPQIYLIDGGSKIPVTSFDVTGSFGISDWGFASAAALNAYRTASQPLSYGAVCDGVQGIAAGSSIWTLPSTMSSTFPFGFVTLDPTTCQLLRQSGTAVPFIRTGDGTIFQVEAGVKYHLSYSSWRTLDPSGAWIGVSTGFAAAIPSGASR